MDNITTIRKAYHVLATVYATKPAKTQYYESKAKTENRYYTHLGFWAIWAINLFSIWFEQQRIEFFFSFRSWFRLQNVMKSMLRTFSSDSMPKLFRIQFIILIQIPYIEVESSFCVYRDDLPLSYFLFGSEWPED